MHLMITFQQLEPNLLMRRPLSAYRLYGNFGKHFPSNGTGIFLVPKTGTGLSYTIHKMLVNFSLSPYMMPGTSNPNKW